MAVQRESQLAAEQIAQGVTALGRANHAQTGLYAQAFFGLSIGLERMSKLIFLADHSINNNGIFPTNKDLRSFCHDISSLLCKCESIGSTLGPGREYPNRPIDPIHAGIGEVLSLFGTQLRYYNLNYLAGGAGDQRDPVALWWERVAVPICQRHYSKRQRDKDEADAAMMEFAVGDDSIVLHTTEDGRPINNVCAFFGRAGATLVAQNFGRMYVLQIVRWLAAIIFELSHKGAYECRIEALLGMHEPFAMFMNEDSYLRKWKSWTIYP